MTELADDAVARALGPAAAPRWVPGGFYRLRDGLLECTLCPHRCALEDGQTGQCAVRRRRGDVVESATFATSVVHLDAIERKPLYHVRPGTPTVTLAAPGCTFRCNYCVNHRLSQFGRSAEAIGTARAVDPAEIVRFAAERSACIAISYTEPALAAELTLELARLGRPLGVDVVWKSNGFLTPELLAAVGPVLAAVNVDLKAGDDRKHRRLTGAPLGPVVEALRLLKSSGTWVEVSTPLIPTVSDTPADLERIAALVAGIDPGMPWHLLRFTPAYRMAHHRPTSPADLEVGVRIGRAAGLRYVYVERALGAVGRNTCCPACGAVVVERGVWRVEVNRLRGGACPECGMELEGRW